MKYRALFLIVTIFAFDAVAGEAKSLPRNNAITTRAGKKQLPFGLRHSPFNVSAQTQPSNARDQKCVAILLSFWSRWLGMIFLKQPPKQDSGCGYDCNRTRD